MDLSKNSVWRYECLARLMNFEQQSFIPTEFLYLVERRHSVANLTQTIFNSSANYFRNINMAWNVNVSLEDMVDPEISLFMRSQLQHYPDPSRISVEITANNALENLVVFDDFANSCRKLGIGITLDHFELHDCDFTKIMSLPIQAIKVSGNYLSAKDENRDSVQRLVELKHLADEHKVTLIAEHIESAETLNAMQKLGFNYAQGFYLSKPKANVE